MLIRRRLIALILVVVTSVLASVIATPGLICQMGGERGGVEAALVCTCGHGDDAQCAMHKHHGSKSSAPTTNRFCAGCHDQVDVVMTALIGFAAPLTDRSEIAPPDGRLAMVRLSGDQPLDFAYQPLSPPPRV